MPEGIRFMLPSRDALASANDKARTGELARSLGVRTPRERVVVSFDEARAALAELGAPMVLKSAREEGLKVLRYVTAAPALEEAWRAVSERSSAGVLAQEMIEGPGWGFCALYEDGRLLRKFMHRRIREWPPSGGASSCADSVVEQPELERAGRALLDALHWNGVAMVEFKGEPERGTLSLMEINAKFWGSHDLALAAGVDFPGDMVARLEGRELAPQLPYRSVRMTWPFGGDLWHGLFQPSSLGAVLRDAWSSRVAHTWRSNDAAPTWRELMQWIRSAPGAAREFRETRKNNPGSEHR
jgi:predicted ATP-grasp superfamily ATP-dependent carboligase